MITTTEPTPVNDHWNEKKDDSKSKFPALTDEDLNFEKGEQDDDMLRKIKISKTREELANIIASL